MTTATPCGPDLIEIEQDGRHSIYIDRDEALALCEQLEQAICGMPVKLNTSTEDQKEAA